MHRPQIRAAMADKNAASRFKTQSLSSLSLPSQLTLKYRKPGQGTTAEVASSDDLKRDLLNREAAALSKGPSAGSVAQALLLNRLEQPTRKRQESAAAAAASRQLTTTADDESSLLLDDLLGDDDELAQFKDQDADVEDADNGPTDAADRDDDDDEPEDSDSDSDSDDDEEELMREFLRIKEEREEDKRKQEAEESEAKEKVLLQQTLQGNPLLQAGAGGRGAGGSKVKRRWDQDVVFRNQAKSEPEVKKRFINDTIRNDFHRRFLNKFIQ